MCFSAIRRLVFSLLVLLSPATFAQAPTDITALEFGKSLVRELVVGQSHNYHIKLQAGQCARIEVEQRGINVLLNISTWDGKFWFLVDNEWNSTGTERVIIVAEEAGDYRIWIGPQAAPNAKDVPPGEYQIKVAELRQATADDERLYHAQKLFSDATFYVSRKDEKEREFGFKQAQEWLRLYRSDSDLQAITRLLNLLGDYFVAQHDVAKADEYYQQLAALLQHSGDQRQLAATLARIGVQYYNAREFQKTIEYKRQSLPIWRSLGERQHQVWDLNTLGYAFLRLREIQRSLDSYAQALAIARELNDGAMEADSLENIGNVYMWLDDEERAFAYKTQALRVAERIGAKGTQANLLLDLSEYIAHQEGYLSAPRLLKEHGNKEREIIAMYEKSRDLFRELNSPSEADALTLLALWHARNGERATALELCERALLLSQSRNQLYRSASKVSVSSVYFALGDYEKAIELREEGFREFNGDLDGSANILMELTRYYLQVNRLTEARARIEESIRIKEMLRARLSDQEHRTAVATSYAQAYELYADVLMRIYQQKPEQELLTQAFIATERARARSLLEMLNEARANIRSDVDPALLAREAALQQKLNLLTPRPNDPRKEQSLAANKQAIDAALDELRSVRAQIRQASPRFAELTEPQPPTVREIQTQLLDTDTLLLAYSLGETRSFVWAISSDAIHSYQLPSRDEITKAARRVYDLLTAPQRLSKLTPAQQQKQLNEAEQQYKTEAAALSQMLLGPVANQLGKKRLLIVAPEALQYLPFGVLPVVSSPLSVAKSPIPNNGRRTTDNGQPLIVNHEIINLPSVSVMMLLRQELAQRKPAPKAVAVLADPVFDVNDSRVKVKGLAKADATGASSALARSLRSFDGREGLARLVLSRDEAEAIAATVPENARLKALDFKASRAEAISAELSQYRIVHFATHGLLNAERPELSGLVFSLVDEQGKPQDGFLRLHEIYNLKLPAEMVVLSACQSGLGKDIKGEGMIGLTRGFMYAGAARVVASLWRVDDYATSVLMKKFYRGMLQEKLPAAAALRKAQIEMWQQKQWQSPFYWGAFVLQGEWR